MRIVNLELAGFRGFGNRVTLDLDADAVLVIAPNGQGKTSLFDAILWGLTGTVPRLRCDDSKLLSLYSDSGEMHVRVNLRSSNGETYSISRSSDGSRQRLTLGHGQDLATGTDATTKLLAILWPAALTTNEPSANLAAAMTRSVYLQQDAVRQFVESQSDQERFNAISDLVGSGSITDLQVQLDNARSAWSRATNELLDQERSQRNRVLSLEAQVFNLSARPSSEPPIEPRWKVWWAVLDELGIEARRAPNPDSSDAPLAIDSALKQLQARRSSNERSRMLIERLAADIRSHAEALPTDAVELTSKLTEIERELHAARELLEKAEERSRAEIREKLNQGRSQDELKALAELALRHLGERCPVCDQPYDRPRTGERLRELAQAVRGPAALSGREQIDELSARVEKHNRSLVEIQSKLDQAKRARETYLSWSSDRDRRLRELGIDPAATVNPVEALDKLLGEKNRLSSDLTTLQENGEGMALQIARLGEGARKLEVQKELAAAKDQLKKLEDDLSLRQHTWELATGILEALREASTDFVDSELTRIEPLLQRIYARVDPHPSFRLVKFLTSFAHRRGRLLMSIFDPSTRLSSDTPEVVLSSSQLNALAVSVFLCLNLGVPTLPLQTAILDDPLQSLDDINLLGVIDLLRRTRDVRQLIVSTHDPRFGDLLAKKLRPVSREQRTQIIEFEGWTRRGPTVIDQREIGQDLRPLKIAV
jgi:exonuclease SbcC